MNAVRFQQPNFRLSVNDILNHIIKDYSYSENRSTNQNYPAVNVIEEEKSFGLEFLVPGFEKENFSITNKDGVLYVKAEAQKKESPKENYIRKSFQIQAFERAFHLPENVNYKTISAKYTNGIIKVEIPKKEDVAINSELNIPIQ